VSWNDENEKKMWIIQLINGKCKNISKDEILERKILTNKIEYVIWKQGFSSTQL